MLPCTSARPPHHTLCRRPRRSPSQRGHHTWAHHLGSCKLPRGAERARMRASPCRKIVCSRRWLALGHRRRRGASGCPLLQAGDPGDCAALL